jgi:arabinogalactan endo-1,4-beta-galactosidase
MSMILCFIAAAGVSSATEQQFIRGVDISSLEMVETGGGVFSDEGAEGDAIEIFRDHGVNFIRLRLWHSPQRTCGSFRSVRRLADRGRRAGMGFLLDIHYSDTWADPGKQHPPAAWRGLTFDSLVDSVRKYTADVVSRLRASGIPPDIVQLGNEISCGMLWDEGKVCGSYDNEMSWRKLAELLGAASKGVAAGSGEAESPRIMIHFDDGADNGKCRWFFDGIVASGVDFDIIGLSFYPWWHGTLDDLEANLRDLSSRYAKDIIVVETAYPWTLDWLDGKHNLVGEERQLLAEYPATADGQNLFLEKVIEIVQCSPEERGIGVFYWAPEWISTPNESSPWENMTLFDFSGNALISVRAYEN